MKRISALVLCLLVSLLFTTSLLYAQKSTGTITGQVTDPQGAVVPGAQVTITNQANGSTRTARTTSAGVYNAADLDVGTYTVQIKAADFKEFVIKNVQLDVASTATVNAHLQVGSVSETVTVEANAVSVETTTGAVGEVITGTEVRELPLNGNNFIELTQLVPGVSSLSDFNTVKKGLEGNTDFSVNGNMTTGNIFMVDGVNNNDIGSNRTILIYPSIQAIQEFKMLRNSYSAEYGQASGAIINIVTRSGTNQFHGGASYYGRNTALNATDYFTKQFEAVNPLISKDIVKRNDYLFNFGGPIVKDKLFFFVSEEWNREIRGQTRAGSVPTLQERDGNFTDIPDPVAPTMTGLTNNACPEPYPTDGTKVPAAGGGFTWEPYFGPGKQNIIPNASLSPFGMLYMGNFPLPNLSSPVQCGNWAQNFSIPVNYREDHVRGDWNLTPTLKVMARYTRDTWENPLSTLGFWGEDPWPNLTDSWTQPSSQATMKITKLLGPTAVNDFQLSFGANAINVARTGTGAGGNYFSSPGTVGGSLTPSAFVSAVDSLSLPYFPLSDKALSIQGGLGEPGFWGNGPVGINCVTGGCQGALAQQGPWHNNEQLLILKDDFNKVIGGHSFKAGFLATSNQKNQRAQNESLGENAAYWSSTADSWGGPSSSQNGVFDMLQAGTQWGFGESSTNQFLKMRWHDYEFYAADNFRIRPNVTLDYGVRWSFLRNATNGNGNMGWFEPNLFNASLAQVNSPCNGMLLTSVGIADCQAAGLQGGTLGADTGLVPNNNHLIQPRVGIAWDIFGNGKTALRVGFGTFYNRFMLNLAMGAPGNPPYVFGLPSSISQRAFDNPAPAFAGVIGTKPAIGIAQNDNLPESIQYNLSIEHQLARNTTFELGYVGNQGRHLEQFTNANMPTTLAGRIAYALSGFNGNANQALTPFGQFTGWSAIQFGSFSGNSHYDSLQALFKTRLKSVDAQFAYTWSHALSSADLTDSSGSQQGVGTSGGDTLIANVANSNYGNSIINRPSILVGNIVYNAPKLQDRNAFMRAAFGSWETSSIVQYTSGASITIGDGGFGNDIVGDGFSNANRPNVVAGQSCTGGNLQEGFFINPKAFTIDHYAVGALPNSERGACFGPGIANTDFSLRKNFKITEHLNARFSMDFFNVFNKTQFLPSSVNTGLAQSGHTQLCDAAHVGTGVCTGYALNTLEWDGTTTQNFGAASADRGPRQIQYGLRLEF